MNTQCAATILLLAFALAGCSRPVKVSGEVFIKNGEQIVPQKGILICFLTKTQHADFEQKLEVWRQFERNEYIESLKKDAEEYSSITKGHTRGDGKVYEEDVGKENYARMKLLGEQLLRNNNKAEDKYWKDQLPHLDQEELNIVMSTTSQEFKNALSTKTPPNSISQPLPELHNCVTNSEGKFETELSSNEPVWIYCISESQYTPGGGLSRIYWYFRYMPTKTQLVLSSANGHFQVDN